MCGRFALGIPKKRLEEVFGLPVPDDYAPRYNIAPGHGILAVTNGGFAWKRWGLVPPWADDPKIGYKMINARSETVFDKPAFREAVRHSRCLVPVQAFYEWKRDGKTKQPFAIGMKNTDVFAMAGIMSCWQSRESGESIDSLAVLTCEPNVLMASIHDRMPVILPSETWADWLSPGYGSSGQLAPLLEPYPASAMQVWPVEANVNSVSNDGPGLLDKVAIVTEKQGSLL